MILAGRPRGLFGKYSAFSKGFGTYQSKSCHILGKIFASSMNSDQFSPRVCVLGFLLTRGFGAFSMKELQRTYRVSANIVGSALGA